MEIKMIGPFDQNKTGQNRMEIQMIKPFDQEKSSNSSSQDHDGDRCSQRGSLVTIFKFIFILIQFIFLLPRRQPGNYL